MMLKFHDACSVRVHVCSYQCYVVQMNGLLFYSYFQFILFFIIYMHILYMIVFLCEQVEEREMLPTLPSPLFSTLNSSCQRFCTNVLQICTSQIRSKSCTDCLPQGHITLVFNAGKPHTRGTKLEKKKSTFFFYDLSRLNL